MERHVFERHSDFGWKCPGGKELFTRKNVAHGCTVAKKDMICFDNTTRPVQEEETPKWLWTNLNVSCWVPNSNI